MTCQGPTRGLARDEVEGARKAFPERVSKAAQRALEEGHVGDPTREAGQLVGGPESGAHEDGLEAVGQPGDADGAVLLEHRPMVGDAPASQPELAPASMARWPAGGSSGHTSPMFDERPDIQARLDDELVIWLTTVNAAGQPQTSPVWFLVEDESIVVYSLAQTPRTRNIAANPKVSLNLNSTPSGGDVVIIEGRAEIVTDGRPAHEDEGYVAKYASAMDDLGMTPASFAADYPVRIHVQPTRLRAS